MTARKRPPTPVIIGSLIGLALIVLVGFALRAVLLAPAQKKQREVQNIQIVRPPPPPPENQPPPPPPQDHQPEQVPQNEPDPSPDNNPSQAGPLGLDAEGGAGSDAFGLAARKGGRDLAGSGGAIFGWYTQILRDAINDRLATEKELRSRRYSVLLSVHVNTDGSIADAHLLSSTGSKDTDALIERTIAKVGRLHEERPREMPAQVKLRISSRL
jgi:outer membrane biosynthesis protein TonB